MSWTFSRQTVSIAVHRARQASDGAPDNELGLKAHNARRQISLFKTFQKKLRREATNFRCRLRNDSNWRVRECRQREIVKTNE